MEKMPLTYTGYIYLWYDTIKKWYYIGGHYGLVEDSYICSSTAMKRSYTKRPQTFKFKVLEYINGSILDLRSSEQRWLNMIKDKELLLSQNVKNRTCRYYNAKKNSSGGSHKGHTKNRIKPAWNKGITREMALLRAQGTFYLLSCDKPKDNSKVNKYPYTNTCKQCKKEFFITRYPHKSFCSISCSSSYNNSRRKRKGRKRKDCIINIICQKCDKSFNSKKKRKYCSKECRYSNVTAWNKGIKSSTGAINGKSGAMKQSKTTTGRKIIINDNGDRIWYYPNKK